MTGACGGAVTEPELEVPGGAGSDLAEAVRLLARVEREEELVLGARHDRRAEAVVRALDAELPVTEGVPRGLVRAAEGDAKLI